MPFWTDSSAIFYPGESCLPTEVRCHYAPQASAGWVHAGEVPMSRYKTARPLIRLVSLLALLGQVMLGNIEACRDSEAALGADGGAG